jgi:ubiquinone/menaquinone biosynthesis C-methylase UbiE
VFAVDVAPTFVRLAAEMERKEENAIRYAAASAVELPFARAQFDFATAVMSLMGALVVFGRPT